MPSRAIPFLLVALLFAGSAHAQDRGTQLAYTPGAAVTEIVAAEAAPPQDSTPGEVDPEQTPADAPSVHSAPEQAPEHAPERTPDRGIAERTSEAIEGAAAPAAETSEAAPVDPLGRDTPRGVVSGFLAAVGQDDYDEAARYLDLSAIQGDISPFKARQLARTFERLLDRSGQIFPNLQISLDPQGNTNDKLDPWLDRIGVLRVGGEPTPLTVTRTPDPVTGGEIWLFSREVVASIPELSQEAGAAPIDRLAAAITAGNPTQWTLLGAPVSHWVATFVVVCLAFGLATGAVLGASRLVTTIWSARPRLIAVVRAVRTPAILLIATSTVNVACNLLGISVVLRSRMASPLEIASWAAMAWIVWSTADSTAGFAIDRMRERNQPAAISIARMMRRGVKLSVIAIAIAAAFTTLGFNLTGWVAAFGLGGLAIALGAQKTIEHLVGSLTLIADQPVQIGDFIAVDGIQGTVEDIGVRSSRIRTLDRTLVTIPNGTLSSARIENYSRRDHFYLASFVDFPVDSDRLAVEDALGAMRDLLARHPRVMENGQQARLIQLGPIVLRAEIRANIVASDPETFTATREELLLKIWEIVTDRGLRLAAPALALTAA